MPTRHGHWPAAVPGLGSRHDPSRHVNCLTEASFPRPPSLSLAVVLPSHHHTPFSAFSARVRDFHLVSSHGFAPSRSFFPFSSHSLHSQAP